jgi:glycosyltransferase involved in cell wall biosynthesis
MSSVTVNGRFLTRPQSGVDRFAAELLRAWLPLSGRQVKTMLPPQSQVDGSYTLKVPLTPVGHLRGHLWEQFDLPRYCADSFLINLCNTGPVRYRNELVVLHDASTMANPGNFSRSFRVWYRWLFSQLMRKAKVVATVSRFSAMELRKYVGNPRSNIEIIYEGGEHILASPADPAILKRLDIVGRPYILAVGNRTANKNFLGVVQAANLLTGTDIKVVAAGGSNSRVFAGTNLDGPNLILAGYVTDAELRALYEGALCFVYPSFYEGFGLPPLEAMHCGCPVVVSNRASLPEVCGKAAAYCNPDDPADIARQLRRVLESRSLQEELKAAGYERAKRFTWSGAAVRLEEILGAAGVPA